MEVVKELLMVYCEINMIYIELHKLEINNNNGDRYNYLISLLKKDLCREREIFSLISMDEEFDYDELYFLLEKCTDKPFNIRAEDYILNDDTNISDIDGEFFSEIIGDIKYSKLYNACSKNMYLIYLSILQEYADSGSFSYLRDKILNYKYYNSFINHGIESILIESNFNIDRVNYINLDVIKDILKLDDDNNAILDCCVDTIRTTIKQILSIDDNDYSDDKMLVLSINNQSMLRASLLLISERDYINIKTSIFNEYEGLCTEDNKISASIIESIFDGRKSDLVRVKKISLKPLMDC